MTERPWDDFEDLGPVRFPLPEGHPLLEDEDALEAALLHDALASVVGRMDAAEEEWSRKRASPARRLAQFGQGMRDLAAGWIQLEPEVALQGRDVRNTPVGDSESGADGTGFRDGTDKDFGTETKGAERPPECEECQ